MATATAPNGKEDTIRAIVFREGEIYVAQCLEYDIATQAKDIQTLVERLELTLEAEFSYCEAENKKPHEAIVPAPNYYHDLWESRYMALDRIAVQKPTGFANLELALAKAA